MVRFSFEVVVCSVVNIVPLNGSGAAAVSDPRISVEEVLRNALLLVSIGLDLS
jgi:hypothetical protein